MSSRPRPGSHRSLAAAITLVIGIVLAFIALPPRTSNAQQSDEPAELVIRDQTFALAGGANAHFELELPIDLPEVPANPPSTTAPPTTVAPTPPPTTAPPPATSAPSLDPTATDPGSSATPTATSAPSTAPTTTAAPKPQLNVQFIAYSAVSTRSGVDEIIDGREPERSVDTVTVELLPNATRRDDGTITMSIDIASTAAGRAPTKLDLSKPGLYPIAIRIRRGDEVLASTMTFLERIRADGYGRGPFTFSIVAAATDFGPKPTVDEFAAISENVQRIITLADAVNDPITVAIPPSYLIQIEGDTELRDRLRTSLAGDEIVALPAFPLNPTAIADADLAAFHAAVRRAGTEILAAGLPDSVIVENVALIDRPISAAGADVLDDVGVGFALLRDDTYRAMPGNLGDFTDPTLLFSAAIDDDEIMRAGVLDPSVSNLAVDRADDTTPVEAAIRFMALTSATRQQLDLDVRGLVLTSPDIGLPDPEVIEFLEHFVAEHPDFTLQPLSEFARTTNSQFVGGNPLIVDWPQVTDQRLVQRAADIGSASLRSLDIASMLPDDDDRPERWSSELAQAQSTALSSVESFRMINSVLAEINAVADSVQPPSQYSFTLPGSKSSLRVSLANRGPTPLTVAIRIDAERLQSVEESTTVELPPDSDTDIRIPVIVQTNGHTDVNVEVRTPAGNLLFEPIQLNGRVYTYSGLGRVVSVGALLVLASWWLSYIRRRHRGRTTG